MKNAEQKLQQQIDSLPKELSPQRDLWPGIERALHTQQIAPNNKHTVSMKKVYVPLAWAASVLFAVGITWVNLQPQSQMQPLSLVAQMQTDFEQQKQLLLVSYGQPDTSQLPADMQAELAKLASARKTIEQALTEDPKNSDLLNLLRWTQQQELDFIEQLYRPKWQSI